MSLDLFLATNFVIFIIGALGTFLNRRNFIIMLLCIELMLLSANLIFLNASVGLDDMNGQLLALLVMTAAAAETALGLALCVLHYRLRGTLDVEFINLMKGSDLPLHLPLRSKSNGKYKDKATLCSIFMISLNLLTFFFTCD